jgi:hypothetical protein
VSIPFAPVCGTGARAAARACTAGLLSAPLWLFLPLLVVTSCVALSWNGLALAAVPKQLADRSLHA